MKTYSQHFIDDGQHIGWVVISEESDEHGDIIDTEEINCYATEKAAENAVNRLTLAELLNFDDD